MRAIVGVAVALGAVLTFTTTAVADPFFFSTGFNPDGKMAALSRPANTGVLQTETADDFIVDQQTSIDHASFIGLLPSGTPLSSVNRVEIEFYHVFPADSAPPSGNVPSRVNSPADVEIGSATRDSLDGSLSAIPAILSPTFSVLNSVVNGINKKPNQTTMGEGPVTGEEVLFNVAFNTPVLLSAAHYFFRPEVQLADGNFLWLSAPRPIVAPGTPLSTDLQAWIRNDNLAPDWLRIGTDIVGGTTPPTFNMEFSLSGEVVPEPATVGLVGLGLVGLGVAHRLGNERRRREVDPIP
jgi:PEP-CTERM motif-containing protein